MNKRNGKYPNLIVEEVPEGFKKLEPIKGQRKVAPKISWGKVYQEKTPLQKVEYLEVLASSMNHAADLLQQERNNLLAVLASKDKQIKQSAMRSQQQHDMIQRQMTKMNAEKQELNKIIVELQMTIKTQKREIKELSGNNDK